MHAVLELSNLHLLRLNICLLEDRVEILAPVEMFIALSIAVMVSSPRLSAVLQSRKMMIGLAWDRVEATIEGAVDVAGVVEFVLLNIESTFCYLFSASQLSNLKFFSCLLVV